MHIALIGCRESLIDYLPELKQRLSARIAGAKITLDYAAKSADLPVLVSRNSKADLVFVSHIYETPDENLHTALRGITDLRISRHFHMLDDIEQNAEISDYSEAEFGGGKKSRIEKWETKILEHFFGKEKEKTSDEIEFGYTRLSNPDIS
jgi:hypothetical protein